MAMGNLAADTTIFKRKFRWGMEIIPNCSGISKIDEYFVKIAARPNISFEETEINMKNGKMFIPGKATWETITVTLYDIVGQQVQMGIKGIYQWINAVYQFNQVNGLQYSLCMGNALKDYSATINLTLYSGCGDPLEKWKLTDAWPQAVNFGELDYSSSEEVTVELTIRYANVSYDPVCYTLDLPTCCTPCQ